MLLLLGLSLADGLSSAATDIARFFKPGALRVLILSGRNNHDWRTTTPFLRKLLADTGRFDVRVCEEPAGLTSETLSAYDAMVVDYCGPRWGTTTEKAVESFVRSGKGRVFYTALGHEVPAMSETGFITTFVRGAEWAASGKVTLPPDIAESKPQADRLRLLVVTGGHDYEPSFYTVFEGYGDWNWTHAVSNQAAFKSDLRKKYDVVVLYDFSQDLDEKGRKNLQDFLESDKGLVVLHHAIADYQAWPWWYQEVVGGKYLLRAEGSTPGSTYKHDEELLVRPVGTHPITSGIGPLHIRDETYKGMWMSPNNKILLQTDNPTSDGPIAWISSYPKSRVVYLELGHDSAAHRNPAYRALVRNSILWTAGRLR
jgi:type 1 glutamine amidotransferase